MFYEPTCIKTGENLHASRRITKYFRFKRGISISEGCFGGKNSTETEITRNFKNLRFSNNNGKIGKLFKFLEFFVSVEFLPQGCFKKP